MRRAVLAVSSRVMMECVTEAENAVACRRVTVQRSRDGAAPRPMLLASVTQRRGRCRHQSCSVAASAVSFASPGNVRQTFNGIRHLLAYGVCGRSRSIRYLSPHE